MKLELKLKFVQEVPEGKLNNMLEEIKKFDQQYQLEDFDLALQNAYNIDKKAYELGVDILRL